MAHLPDESADGANHLGIHRGEGNFIQTGS